MRRSGRLPSPRQMGKASPRVTRRPGSSCASPSSSGLLEKSLPAKMVRLLCKGCDCAPPPLTRKTTQPGPGMPAWSFSVCPPRRSVKTSPLLLFVIGILPSLPPSNRVSFGEAAPDAPPVDVPVDQPGRYVAVATAPGLRQVSAEIVVDGPGEDEVPVQTQTSLEIHPEKKGIQPGRDRGVSDPRARYRPRLGQRGDRSHFGYPADSASRATPRASSSRSKRNTRRMPRSPSTCCDPATTTVYRRSASATYNYGSVGPTAYSICIPPWKHLASGLVTRCAARCESTARADPFPRLT